MKNIRVFVYWIVYFFWSLCLQVYISIQIGIIAIYRDACLCGKYDMM